MHATRRHLIKDGLRIAAVTIASFGIFYFAMAQTSLTTTGDATTGDATTIARAVCGNLICEQTLGESLESCKIDCVTATDPVADTTDTNTVSTATIAVCGNAVVDAASEMCDNGPNNGVACVAGYGQECRFCTASCVLESRIGPRCGDGFCQTDKENPDSCSSDCRATTTATTTTTTPTTDGTESPAFCGNSVQDSGEQCDLGAKNGVVCVASYAGSCKFCTSACMVEEKRGPFCGDRICQATMETSASCASDCVSTSTTTTTTATETAKVAACGNGVKEGVEACDEGAKNGAVCIPTVYGESCRFCSAACVLETKLGPRCGDRICQKDKEDSLKCPMDCGALPAACTDRGIATIEECEKYLASLTNVTATPTVGAPFCGNLICEAETGETYERCSKDCPKPATATEPVVAPIAPATTTTTTTVPEECRKVGILNVDACKKYLSDLAARAAQQNIVTPVTATVPVPPVEVPVVEPTKPAEPVLPELCRLRGITSLEECKLLLQKAMFSTASTSAETDEDAVKPPAATSETNQKSGVSDACASRGATTAEECRAIVVASALPEACRKAGALDDESCKKVLAATAEEGTLVPLACREKGVFTVEGCKAYLLTTKDVLATTVVPTLPNECVEQGMTDPAVCRRYLALKNLPESCRTAGIEDSGECDAFLQKTRMEPACAAQGITDPASCKEFMYERVAKGVSCVGMGAEECAIALKERNLGKVMEAQEGIAKVDALFRDDAGNESDGASVCFKDGAGNVASSGDLNNMPIVTRPCLKDGMGVVIGVDLAALKKEASEDDFADVIDSLPLKPDTDVTLRLLRSEQQMALGGDDSLRAAAGTMIAFDADGDGVPNDVERRFGLDPNNADTDGDGEGDDVEFKQRATKGIDTAIADGVVIGQPLTEGETDESLTLRLAPLQGGLEGSPKTPSLAGTGTPGEVVTLYIYSDMPIVVTTTVDENGQWSYELGDTLKDGPHEVYVAINDDTGRVARKSNPLALFIAGASAATTADAATESVAIEMLDAQANALQGTAVQTNLTYFLLGGGVLILIALALVAAIMRQKEGGSGPMMGA